jgi:hypothetical protein
MTSPPTRTFHAHCCFDRAVLIQINDQSRPRLIRQPRWIAK